MRKRATALAAGLGVAALVAPAAAISAGGGAAPTVVAVPPAAAAAPAAPAAAAAPARAKAPARRDWHGTRVAVLRLANGRPVGVVHFTGAARGLTRVTAWVRVPASLTPGSSFHGFHVHANDNPANGSGCVADPAQPPATWFVSADGHYTRPGRVHGQHDGDMPVLYVTRTGIAATTFYTDRFSPREIVRRAVIVHARPDNYANIPVGDLETQYTPNSPAATALTLATGNAGDRIACGVVR